MKKLILAAVFATIAAACNTVKADEESEYLQEQREVTFTLNKMREYSDMIMEANVNQQNCEWAKTATAAQIRARMAEKEEYYNPQNPSDVLQNRMEDLNMFYCFSHYHK